MNHQRHYVIIVVDKLVKPCPLGHLAKRKHYLTHSVLAEKSGAQIPTDFVRKSRNSASWEKNQRRSFRRNFRKLTACARSSITAPQNIAQLITVHNPKELDKIRRSSNWYIWKREFNHTIGEHWHIVTDYQVEPNGNHTKPVSDFVGLMEYLSKNPEIGGNCWSASQNLKQLKPPVVEVENKKRYSKEAEDKEIKAYYKESGKKIGVISLNQRIFLKYHQILKNEREINPKKEISALRSLALRDAIQFYRQL